MSCKFGRTYKVDHTTQPHGANDHQKHTRTPHRHTKTIPEGRPLTYYAKKSEATVPARSTRQRQFDEHQTIISRHPIRRRDTAKLPRNDGRTPMSSLRFYADTYIITTYYLNSTSVTCIFSYVIYVAWRNPSMHNTLRPHLRKGLKMTHM
jgi:hypothetical protein